MTERQPQTGPAGVVATLQELVRLRPRVRRRRAAPPRATKTQLAGPYRSVSRGRGMDFEEVRPYQPGDDARTIDWRVTARTGSPYSKVFHEERERPVWLCVDQGPTLRFGTRHAFKSVTATRAAALLAWEARESGDRVGAVVRGSDRLTAVAPGRGDPHVLRVLAELAAATAAAVSPAAPNLDACLRRLRSLARAGSRVFVLSDFYELGEATGRWLGDLALRCEVTCVWIYDALEAAAPPPGRYRITDGERVAAISSRGRRWREDYAARFAARRDALRQACLERRIELRALRTDEDPSQLLARRAARGGAR